MLDMRIVILCHDSQNLSDNKNCVKNSRPWCQNDMGDKEDTVATDVFLDLEHRKPVVLR